MSILATLVAEIKVKLDLLAGASIECVIGNTEIFKNASPPRVIFEPTSFRFGPPRGPWQNPKPRGTHHQRIVVHVWGADSGDTDANYTACETLLLRTEAAIDQVLHGSLDMTGGEIIPNRHLNKGWAAMFPIEVATAFTDAELGTALITVVGHTSGLEGSGQSGCSS